jgi:hypothetical protein
MISTYRATMLALPLALVLLFGVQSSSSSAIISSDRSNRRAQQFQQHTLSSLTDTAVRASEPEGVTPTTAAAAPVRQRTAGQEPAQSANLAAKAKRSYQSMMRAPLYGPDWLLRKGLKNELNGRNWRRLAAKLAAPGSNITVVVFGGSVSTGFALPRRSANWMGQFSDWLQSAFKHTNIIQVRSCY